MSAIIQLDLSVFNAVYVLFLKYIAYSTKPAIHSLSKVSATVSLSMQLELTPKITIDWLKLICSTFTHLHTVASGDVDIPHMVYVTQVHPPGWPGFAICYCTFVNVWVMVAIDSVVSDIRPVYWRLPGVLSEGQVLYKIQSNFYITESFPSSILLTPYSSSMRAGVDFCELNIWVVLFICHCNVIGNNVLQ